jgi:hypothetical protein
MFVFSSAIWVANMTASWESCCRGQEVRDDRGEVALEDVVGREANKEESKLLGQVARNRKEQETVETRTLDSVDPAELPRLNLRVSC